MSAPNRFTDLRDDDAREYEADALRRRVAGILFQYHCYHCHRRHGIASEVGRRHELYGDPAIVRACKRAVLDFATRDMAVR